MQKIYAVGREETAWELKHKHPEYLMAGERGGVILPGFDYGNSPSQTEHADFQGKILIHTTSAGTQGLVHTCAAGADEIITGSLVNASAIASYIANRNPERVSLVCMGNSGIAPAPGTAGFDLDEMAWQESTLKEDVEFLIRVTEEAQKERTFRKLPYEANTSIVLPRLKRFALLVDQMTAENRSFSGCFMRKRVQHLQACGGERGMYEYITLREKPDLKETAAQWFHNKFGVQAQAYLDCMDLYLEAKTEYGWYLCLNGDQIIGGMGVFLYGSGGW